jgi:hypothetical protein
MIICDTRKQVGILCSLEDAANCFCCLLNPSVLSAEELARRVEVDHAFEQQVLRQPTLWVADPRVSFSFASLPATPTRHPPKVRTRLSA